MLNSHLPMAGGGFLIFLFENGSSNENESYENKGSLANGIRVIGARLI
jgi:hypothetical protein